MHKSMKRVMKISAMFVLLLATLLLVKGKEVFATTVPSGYAERWSFDENAIGEHGSNFNSFNYNYSLDAILGKESLSSTSNIRTASTSISVDSGVTVSFWIKLDSSMNDTDNYGIFRAGDTSYDFSIAYYQGHIEVYRYDGARLLLSGSAISKDQWHLITVTSDATSSYLYIDGAEVNRTVGDGENSIIDPFYGYPITTIYVGYGSAFSGLMDDLMIYSTKLLVSDVMNLYQYYLSNNIAPKDISLSATSIDEYCADGTAIGTLSSSDLNGGNTFTYTLEAGTGSTDNASFNISDGSLRITSSPVYKTKSSYSVCIRTTDQGELHFEKIFTITIKDVNEIPTDITLGSSSINENVAGNSSIGTLSSTDNDAANTFTYTLVAGTGSTDNASFNISGSSLRITASPDFETKSSYSVRIRTTDQGSLNYDEAFTILINDLNEAPTNNALSSSSINENVAGNSSIGTLSSTDNDAGNTFTYTLVAGTGSTDNASFNISGGSLRITSSPDYETKSSYSVRIRTTDQGSLCFEKAFTITINDLNEAPTDFALSGSSINEYVVGNSTVGSLSTTDADAANSFTYTLVAGTGSTDNASFNISGSSLRITSSPVYKTISSYSVRIRTTDQGSLYFEKIFTILINDVNETPTDITLGSSSINENEAGNSTVGIMSSTDNDAGNAFTYTLVAGTGSTDNANFNISGGNLNITNSPNFEAKSSYSVRIRTTDQGGLYFDKPFTVSINDMNETPTDIALSNSSINENVAGNSSIGALSTTDVDAANTFTYTLVAGTGSTDNASFNISGDSLRITSSPDYETKSSYSVRIRTTDQGSLYIEEAFTITINDLNEAPTDIALNSSSINEYVVGNSTVGSLSTTDADAANTFTYTLVAGTGSTDNASFNISGGSLRITSSPVYKTKSSYSVRIRTTDQGSLFFEKAFTITIKDVNETPTDITLGSSSINENVAGNSSVGTLSSTDNDEGNTYIYTLAAGAGSMDNASFNISGSSLRITSSPDYETKSSYSVRIRTTDQGGLYFEKAFTVSINDLNETPTDITLGSSNINENVAGNSTIGTLSSTDNDAGNTFTYTLVAGTGSTDNASFNISGGSLRITSSPDYEIKSSYSVRIRTTDQGSLYFEKAFTITINNLNETPNDIALNSSSINEYVAGNSTVGSFSTTDADAANTFTYTLVAGAGSTDNASFNISGDSLRITGSPVYKTKSSYSVRIRTTDQGSLFFEKAFIININDVNETPTDITLGSSSINEIVAGNSTVGTLSSTDNDAGNTYTYTLVAGAGSTENASFNISGSSLRITGSPDYETKSSYSVRIRTTDQGGLFFEKAFTITINNLNEPPTDITLGSSNINENVAGNSTIGTLSSTDNDAGNTFTYTLVAGAGSADNASFNISGGSLRITRSPDFETKSSYSVRIRTTDQGSLYFEKAFTITINDLNEAPNNIALSSSSINEYVAGNSTVGSLSTTDADAANTFTYTLVAGAGSSDNASFNILGGSLRITSSPDVQTKSSYSVRIRSTDQASLYFDKTFTILINDVNETPTDITLGSSSINENVAGNSSVGTLSSTDNDAGNTYTYTLVAGAGSMDNASFNISGSSLRITGSPDFETKISYSVRIRTTDQGGLYFEKAFTVSINDVNETPTEITLGSSSINENVAGNSTIGSLSSTDIDAGDTFTYTLVAGTGSTDNASFNISSDSLIITSSPDFETKSSYSVRIRTTDALGLTYEKVFTITITNVNEAPTDCNLSNLTVAEHTSAGTAIATLTSTDVDAADTLNYTLVAGTGSTDNASFAIVGDKLKLAFIPDYAWKATYLIRVRTTDADGLYYERAFTITITEVTEIVFVPQAPPIETKKITLEVTNGKSDDSVVQIEVKRTDNEDGTVSDSIVYEDKKTEETIEKLKKDGDDVARIIAPEAEKEVADVTVTIPQKSVELLADSDISLEIETKDVRIDISNMALDQANTELEEDLYFRVTPISEKEQKQEVSDRAKHNGMLVSILGDNISVIGSLMEIETNMPKTMVDIILPLTGITVPTDQQERARLIERLAIYVEHSDGTKEVLQGTLVENSNGTFGLKFSVNSFSTFAIVLNDNLLSNKNKIISVKTPANAEVKGLMIVAKVDSASTKVSLNVSTNATYKVYTDKACTKEAKTKLKLKVGVNKVYVKVTAEDGTVSKAYTVLIIRKK